MDQAPTNELLIRYHAEPTLHLFHQSEAFVRAVRGPMGSGKSVGCVVDMWHMAQQQPPDPWKRRRTKWGCVRNTYPELKSTTLRTFHDWVPEEMCYKNDGSPIQRIAKANLPDGTRVEAEFLFLSVDRPGDVGKLKSLDFTGVWLNEASELPKEVFDMATGRIGRYPRKDLGLAVKPGVLMDTNSMDDDHWWYHLDQNKDDETAQNLRKVMESIGINRPLMEFFTQPPALVEANGVLLPNPAAENVKHQPLGFGYWLQLASGKEQNFIDMMILNKYGRVIDGKPVYPEWDEHFHGKPRQVKAIKGLPILIGLDFGLSPAAVFCQVTPEGRFLILGECVAEVLSMGFRQFVRDALKPYMALKFGATFQFRMVGDPAGNKRSDSDMGYCFKEAEDAGFDISAAPTNMYFPRRESLAHFMRGHIGGEPALLIDSSCRMLRAGLGGRYHYRRVNQAGDIRYKEEPYKNKWSHVCEAAQYAALEITGIIEEQGEQEQEQPQWMRDVNLGMTLKPWQMRGRSLQR